MDLNIFKNKLLVGEGLDETGKSSVMELLYRDLIDSGIKTILTKQPGGDWGPMAPLIRSMCKDKRFNLSSYTNLFLFLADRVECLEKVIKPALDSGKTVICDRWSYSTVAYQLYGKGIFDDFKYILKSENKAEIIKEWIEDSFFNINPDYTFYFCTKVGKRDKDLYDNFENNGSTFESRGKNAYDEMSRRLDW